MLLSLLVTTAYIATGSFRILLTFVGEADHVLHPSNVFLFIRFVMLK